MNRNRKKKHPLLHFFAFALLFLFTVLLPSSRPCLAGQSVSQGIYQISCELNENFVLDIPSCTQTDQADTEPAENSLQMYRALDVNQQKFYLEKISASRFRISSLVSGRFLTALEDDSVVLTDQPVKAENENPETSEIPDSQIWLIRHSPDGCLYLQSAMGGYLTLNDTRPYNGAALSLQEYTRDENQKWLLQETLISAEARADTDLINPFAPDGQYENCALSMWFGSTRETLTAQEIASWLVETEDHTLTAPEEAFLAYAQSLADQYDTVGYPRSFQTSYGTTITLYQGNFGWKLDVEATAKALMDSISNTPHFVMPVWSQEGASLTRGDDIGDSYIEIDLTNQKVWLYRDGEQLLETDCVSGTFGTDRQTPGGVYRIFYMQSPAVLRGADYTSPVEYWMAYNGNIGLHDANWRTEFGGDIYKTDGSHGCVNLPTNAAKIIYETISIGYPVVSYN